MLSDQVCPNGHHVKRERGTPCLICAASPRSQACTKGHMWLGQDGGACPICEQCTICGNQRSRHSAGCADSPVSIAAKELDERDTLLATIEILSAQNHALNDNLTATQTRCTELLEEVRALRDRGRAGHTIGDPESDYCALCTCWLQDRRCPANPSGHGCAPTFRVEPREKFPSLPGGDPCALCGMPVPLDRPELFECPKHPSGGWCFAK